MPASRRAASRNASRSVPAPVSRTHRLGPAATWAAVAALVAALVYLDTLGNDLVYDDLGVIVANRAVRAPADWRTIFLSHSWFAAPSREHRPLTTWTFALDYAAHGLRPFGYHLVNVLAHGVVSALVVPAALAAGATVPAAGVAAVLFAVHPIHTEAVAAAVGRAELLAAAFVLLALVLQRRVDGAARPAAVVAGVTAAYALALLAKEHAAAFVLVAPLADLLLADGASIAVFRRRLAGRRLALYAGLVAVTLGYLALRRAALGDLIGAGGVVAPAAWQNPAAGAVWWRRMLTALDVQRRALLLLVLPIRLSADYSYRTIPVVDSLAEPRALLGLLVAAALVAGAGVCAWSGRRQALFWLLFGWLFYLPVSNLPFPIGTIFAERILYLPSVAFCVLLGAGLSRWRPAGLALAAALALAYGARTWTRNLVWHDELSLAEATVAASPESTQAHRLLGWAYARRGREDDAVGEYRRAVDVDPENPIALADLGELLRRRGGPDEMATGFRAVTERAPESAPAWTSLGFAEVARGRFADGLAAAERALTVRPGYARAEALRGFALRGLARPAEAQQAFERALADDRTTAEAYTGLAALALDRGDFTDSAAIFERMIAAVDSRDAYAGLVESHRRAGRTADAERALAAARRRFPGDPTLR